jgi:hypothetical protein
MLMCSPLLSSFYLLIGLVPDGVDHSCILYWIIFVFLSLYHRTIRYYPFHFHHYIRPSPAIAAPALPSCGAPGEMGKGWFQQRPAPIPQIAASPVLRMAGVECRPPAELRLPLQSATHLSHVPPTPHRALPVAELLPPHGSLGLAGPRYVR